MNRRICTLGGVRYVLSSEGELQVYKVEAGDGLPGVDWQPLHIEPSAKEFELWRCNNCGKQEYSYEPVRSHLGKFHELIDPFNFEKETPST